MEEGGAGWTGALGRALPQRARTAAAGPLPRLAGTLLACTAALQVSIMISP